MQEEAGFELMRLYHELRTCLDRARSEAIKRRIDEIVAAAQAGFARDPGAPASKRAGAKNVG